MGKMNFMEKLLDGVEVEWKPLGNIAVVQRGASPRPIAKFITDDADGVSWIKIGDTSPNSKYVNHTAQKITREGALKSRVLKKGDFIMSNSMSFGRPYILNINGAIHDGWASISNFENVLNSDYLYHYLTSNIVQKYWVSKINSGSVSNLNADIIKSLQVPIPPMHIQKEIVRILDSFTELKTELTEELTGRKKQYSYYRDGLLSFKGAEVEWKPLAELGEVIRGNGLQKKDFQDSGFPAVHYGQIFTRYGLSAHKTFTYVSTDLASKLKIAKNGDLLIATTSENDEDLLKPVAWLGESTAISGDMMLFRHHQNVKYLAYCFQTRDFQNQKAKYITGAKVRRVSKDNLSKMTVPTPSLAEQERIVSILDNFETLTNSNVAGLPSEIDLRQKQYEYYRDLLFSFSRPEVEGS